MENKYVLKTGSENMDIKLIHSFISQSYWAENIPFDTLKLAIEHSLCFGIFMTDTKDGDHQHQVAFARVITDKATFAYLADVFVLAEHRGKGLSKRMMEAVMQHPELQGLRRFMLATKDAHQLYQQFGFTKSANPTSLMEKWNPNIYKLN